jgi:hypothetical protein
VWGCPPPPALIFKEITMKRPKMDKPNLLTESAVLLEKVQASVKGATPLTVPKLIDKIFDESENPEEMLMVTYLYGYSIGHEEAINQILKGGPAEGN